MRAGLTVLLGQLKYFSEYVDFKDLPEELQREIFRLEDKTLDLLEILRESIIAELQLLQTEKERIEAVFKRHGVRKKRKKSDAGQPTNHKG